MQSPRSIFENYCLTYVNDILGTSPKYYFAIDLNGTIGRLGVYKDPTSPIPLKVAEFPLSLKPVSVDARESEESQNERFLQDMRTLNRQLHDLIRTYDRPRAVGVAIAARVSSDRQTIVIAGNLSHWVDRRITEMIALMTGCKRVVLGNDAEAVAIADRIGLLSVSKNHVPAYTGSTGLVGALALTQMQS